MIVKDLISDAMVKIDSLSNTVVDLPNTEPRTIPEAATAPKTPRTARATDRSTIHQKKVVSTVKPNWFTQLRR
jgi:hypothetical protein